MMVIECKVHGSVEAIYDSMYNLWCARCREDLVRKAFLRIQKEEEEESPTPVTVVRKRTPRS